MVVLGKLEMYCKFLFLCNHKYVGKVPDLGLFFAYEMTSISIWMSCLHFVYVFCKSNTIFEVWNDIELIQLILLLMFN